MYELLPTAAVGVAVNSVVDVLVAGAVLPLATAWRSAVLWPRKLVPQTSVEKGSSAKAREQDGK